VISGAGSVVVWMLTVRNVQRENVSAQVRAGRARGVPIGRRSALIADLWHLQFSMYTN
jgi:hypothetical protein